MLRPGAGDGAGAGAGAPGSPILVDSQPAMSRDEPFPRQRHRGAPGRVTLWLASASSCLALPYPMIHDVRRGRGPF